MDPVTTAAVTAVISSAGTVLAAWVQGRAKRGGRQAAGQDKPVPEAGTGVVTGGGAQTR